MSATKQTTLWCDHEDERGMLRGGRLVCVEWTMLDTGNVREARKLAREFGWSWRAGIGDCCAKHPASSLNGEPE